MPGTAHVVSRRHLLAAGTALALLGTAPGCGSAPPAVDDLESQLELARIDSELAERAAALAPSSIAPALSEVASERSEHARALATEIARVAGKPTSSPGESPTATTTGAAAAPSVSDVVSTLRASANSAGALACASSGYRAGLLGSIAAACTAAYAVALVFS